jgi:hypothetical protein
MLALSRRQSSLPLVDMEPLVAKTTPEQGPGTEISRLTSNANETMKMAILDAGKIAAHSHRRAEGKVVKPTRNFCRKRPLYDLNAIP